MLSEDKLDVVLYGATGFVGTLTAAYLVQHAPDGARIGLAGRSRQRLEELRHRLGGRATDWPVLVADSADRAALDELARGTSVVATTVGPYARHGLPLVAACAEAGTHYADLTGELTFMRESIDTVDPAARRSGARIVHAAGFDSIPSDLGVLLLHDAVTRDRAGDLEDTTFVVTGLRGGVSGGTIASMTAMLDDVTGDSERRRLTMDPYALSSQRDKEPDAVNSGWPSESELRTVTYDAVVGQWLAPFVMAGVNTRVVRRSNALQDWAYGPRLRYREVTGTGGGPVGLAKATALTTGLTAGLLGLAFAPTRSALGRLLPKPGEGPSEKTRNSGYFRIEIHARTSTGARYVAHVAAKGDPGYAATAVMFGESALALAFDEEQLPARSGVLTPATAIGMPLVDRLRTKGFTLDVVSG